MSEQNQKTYEDAEPRAGGDVVTKNASQAPMGEKRAGGDVVTKGPSNEPTDAGKRAGGDVVTKGPSKAG